MRTISEVPTMMRMMKSVLQQSTAGTTSNSRTVPQPSTSASAMSPRSTVLAVQPRKVDLTAVEPRTVDVTTALPAPAEKDAGDKVL